MSRITRSIARQSLIQKDTTASKPVHKRSTSSSEYDDEETNCSRTRKSQQKASKPKANTNKTKLDHISPVTPPKQRRLHVDEDALMTPSSLLKKLALTSPIKEVSEPTSKKNLFSECTSQETEQENISVNKISSRNGMLPIEESSNVENKEKPKSQYLNARKALHSNFPTDMPGREKEIEEIRQFISQHLENGTSGSIYISGPPGTGKTASLNLILEQEDISSKIQKICINCTAIKSASAVYSRLNKELHIKISSKSEKDNLSAFEKYLKRKHKPILILLDEIDQLETKNHSILYTIFEWPARFNSGLILVGIANALDLTDRMLPRLQGRCELKPSLLHFAPYTKSQIIHIFTSRLELAGVLEVFSPIALQMLAGKVAAISGDIRRALDIGRRVVELIDENKKGDILKSVENFTSQLDKESSSSETKKVNLQEVVSVLNNVYGTSQNLTDDSEETFPLQQKMIVCSLLLLLKKAKNKDITIGKLHEIYSVVCKRRNITAVDQAEFVGLCSLIETKGIIKVTRKKEPRMHKVTLEWNENEVSEALKDKQLISTVLQDDACLGKL